MGQSIYETQPCRLVELTDTRTQEANTDGYASDRVYGSYVHGIFDRHEIVESILGALAREKGIETVAEHILDYRAYKETQYDRLAEELRNAIDMPRIYEIMDKGV